MYKDTWKTDNRNSLNVLTLRRNGVGWVGEDINHITF